MYIGEKQGSGAPVGGAFREAFLPETAGRQRAEGRPEELEI